MAETGHRPSQMADVLSPGRKSEVPFDDNILSDDGGTLVEPSHTIKSIIEHNKTSKQ